MDFVDFVKYIYSLDKSNIFNAITKYGIQVDQKVAPEGFISFDALTGIEQVTLFERLIDLYRQPQINMNNNSAEVENIYKDIETFSKSNDVPSEDVLNAMIKLAKKSSEKP